MTKKFLLMGVWLRLFSLRQDPLEGGERHIFQNRFAYHLVSSFSRASSKYVTLVCSLGNWKSTCWLVAFIKIYALWWIAWRVQEKYFLDLSTSLCEGWCLYPSISFPIYPYRQIGWSRPNTWPFHSFSFEMGWLCRRRLFCLWLPIGWSTCWGYLHPEFASVSRLARILG